MASLCNGCIFHSGYFDCRGTFRKVLDSQLILCNGMNIADNEA